MFKFLILSVEAVLLWIIIVIAVGGAVYSIYKVVM